MWMVIVLSLQSFPVPTFRRLRSIPDIFVCLCVRGLFLCNSLSSFLQVTSYHQLARVRSRVRQVAKFRPKIKDLPPKAPAAAGEAAQDDGENGLMLRCHALGTGVYRRNEER